MNDVESLLGHDHEELGQLLAELDVELAKPDLDRAFELLDLFWARLAMHIRAENLHLFPALANAPASLFTGRSGLPTSEEANDTLLILRSDHDFFMKELAEIIKAMRELTGQDDPRSGEIGDVRDRMIVIRDRLEGHNEIEEQQVYTWPRLLFDESTISKLRGRLRHELENLPPRFRIGST